MSIYKQGKKGIYWYEFVHEGRRVRVSTKQRSITIARQLEAEHRTALVRGDIGLRDRKKTPTLELFSERFLASVEIDSEHKPRTLAFYRTAIGGLLSFDKLAKARIDRIEEAEIEEFKQYRKGCVSRRGKPYKISTLNQELVALRRILGLAHEWKVIDRIPKCSC